MRTLLEETRAATDAEPISIKTPLGLMRAVASDEGITQLEFVADEEPGRTLAKLTQRASAPAMDWPAMPPVSAHILRLGVELAEYFAGTRTEFSVPLAPPGTEFELRAWDYLKAIPYGQTRSYGQQARAIGEPNASRAVGRANGMNRIAIVIPCHRVIGSDGKLTGYAAGLDRKRWLLDHERRVSGGTLFQLGRTNFSVAIENPA